MEIKTKLVFRKYETDNSKAHEIDTENNTMSIFVKYANDHHFQQIINNKIKKKKWFGSTAKYEVALIRKGGFESTSQVVEQIEDKDESYYQPTFNLNVSYFCKFSVAKHMELDFINAVQASFGFAQDFKIFLEDVFNTLIKTNLEAVIKEEVRKYRENTIEEIKDEISNIQKAILKRMNNPESKNSVYNVGLNIDGVILDIKAEPLYTMNKNMIKQNIFLKNNMNKTEE